MKVLSNKEMMSSGNVFGFKGNCIERCNTNTYHIVYKVQPLLKFHYIQYLICII